MRGFSGMTRRERKSGGKPRRGVKRVPAARQVRGTRNETTLRRVRVQGAKPCLQGRAWLVRGVKGECILRKDLCYR